MQAMLELGESELVILMAKDAVLRQSQDGRLAMLGEEFALSDACCPGEAVLWAAKKTGDQNLMNGFDKLVDYVLNKAPRTKMGSFIISRTSLRSGATLCTCSRRFLP